ncbi:unnamed protein product [Lasius platythorax]|uniref:BESS domain-containing protein n=3 Tax=Lasius TaxID=488720 RepID=A0A0J7LAK7_LASNI|nr:hypothetical protein RF55_129 [Lasius niger]
MEDNGKVVCNEALEEIDQNIVKVEVMKCEQNFDTEPLAVNLVPPIEEYNTTVLPKRRGRRSKKSLDLIKLQSSTSKLNYSTTDLKLGLWKDRFRPIRPKPLPPGASPLRHKSFGMPPTLNMSTLTPNVTVPSKDKTRCLTTLDSSSKTNCIRVDNDDTGSIIPEVKECKINKNINANLNIMSNSKGLRNTKASLSHKSSIELFFASMAQTVLNLPREVQADIKMQICKIVTMAEVKYSGLQIKG